MTASKILIAEKDLEYGKALARAVSNLHNEFEITIISLESHRNTIKDRSSTFTDFDLILLGGYPEETAAAIRDRIPNGNRIVILAESIVEDLLRQSEMEGKHYWYIYKYRNVNNIISDLNYIIGIISGKKSFVRKSMAPDLIGFYSISGGAGKSVIALGTSRELSRYHDKKVLYLSFEEIPATELFINNNSINRNIGDYLYFLLQKKNENLCSRPEGFTLSDEFGVESFNPANGRNDLNYLSQEELIYFLKMISDGSRYDYLALDLRSDLSEETLFLINLCSRIVLIQNNDPISEFKSRKCIAYLNKLSAIKYIDRFLLVLNQADSPEPDRDDNESLYSKNLKKINIEKDENSFRFSANHLDIDISHAFGIGIKKITDEILSSERKE